MLLGLLGTYKERPCFGVRRGRQFVYKTYAEVRGMLGSVIEGMRPLAPPRFLPCFQC